jgi:DNA-directed DNA polymerase III PolC
MKVSPHTHVESQLTGSPIASMIKRAVDLKREYFSYTDLGHTGSALKTYNMSKKSGLKPILGLEFYFKDSKCNLVTASKADHCKYFNGTIYANTQIAYQELCKVVSKDDMPKIEVLEESQSLWSWNELEHLSKFNTFLVLGGIHDLAGKVLLSDGPELAEKIILKAKSLFESRLFLALICEPWEKKYASVIKISYIDGTYDSLLASDLVTTDRARNIKAFDLINRSGHFEIKHKIVGNTYFEVNKKIDKVTEHKGFLPLPGGDVTLRINNFFLEMGKKYNIKILASDYAFYAEKEDKIVQTMIQEGKNKLKSDLHMKTEEEFLKYLQIVMKMSLNDSVQILMNNDEWAKNFDNFELKYDWRLADSGENALNKCLKIIKNKGLMRWDDPLWTSRLREEIQVIAKNEVMDLSPYFIPIHDVIDHYEKNGRLTGPGRGSSAGSLIAYLMGITKVNPFKYDLSFNRFYSIDRIEAGKLADIDSDLESRDLLVGEDGKSGYLYSRWGSKAAQISTRGKVRLKSAIKDTNRYFNGSVEKEIEALTKGLPDAGQGITDDQFLFGFEDEDGNHIEGLIETSDVLKKYSEIRPKEWAVVKQALGITRSFSKHACAFVIADKPISDFVPIKDGYITQYEASACEEAGLIKYDFLVINQLKDIRVCIDLINKKNKEKNKIGCFTHKDESIYIWDLLEDLEVYKSIWNGSTESCFQISTPGMTSLVKEMMPKNMEDIALILSLERPGPLDYIMEETGRNMVQEYVYRRNGNSYEDIPILNEIIPETYSVLVYQEQITKTAKELAGFNGSDAENLREAIGKKKRTAMLKIKPQFIKGCINSGKITEIEAQQLWDRIVTFGRYAFNKSHAISYSYITYACMFLKHYYPLEWWAAILTNAKEKEITGKLWPYVKDLIAPPDINLSSDQMEIDYANKKIRSKLGIIRGMGDKSIDPIVNSRPYKNIQDFVDKDVSGPSLSRKLIHVGVLDSLFPPNCTLLEKLQLFEDALELKKFNSKTTRKTKNGVEPTPKKGIIPEEYLNIEKDPMKNAAIKKSILPSLLLDLNDLGKNHSVCIVNRTKPSKIFTNQHDKEVLLVNGETLQRLNEMPGDSVLEDKYVASIGFIVETTVFDYKKNTKQALKIIADFSGFVSEFVMWPDYFTGELFYPKELKKGNICTVFFKKRANANSACTITEIVIEA